MTEEAICGLCGDAGEIEIAHRVDTGEPDTAGCPECMWREHESEVRRLEEEKERRVYYQNIVYAVCNLLDRGQKAHIVCGTLKTPSTEVQDRVKWLVDNWQLALAEGIRVQQLADDLAEALACYTKGFPIDRDREEAALAKHAEMKQGGTDEATEGHAADEGGQSFWPCCPR